MRKKNLLIFSVAIMFAVCLIIGTAILLSPITPDSSWGVLAGVGGSILGFILGAIHFAREIISRRDEAEPSEGRPTPFPPRWTSFTWLVVITILAIGFAVAGVIHIALLFDPTTAFRQDVPSYTALSIALPFFTVILLILLHVKVRGVRIVDIQKHYVKELAGVGNSWDPSARQISCLEPHGLPALTEAEGQHMQRLLNSACRNALLIASSTGLSRSAQIDGGTSLLFGANIERKRFSVIASFGATPEYEEVLGKLDLAFLDVRMFAKHYNAFQGTHAEKAKRRRARRLLIREFRDSVQGFASTAGVVYAMERKLAFHDAYSKCLTTSFKFVDQLPETQRNLFKFRQVIGIPISVFNRKIGVLLFFSVTPGRFYIKDKAY